MSADAYWRGWNWRLALFIVAFWIVGYLVGRLLLHAAVVSGLRLVVVR